MKLDQALFPLFLRLDGRRCVVVGSSAEAHEKTARLLACGASVALFAPTLAPSWQTLCQHEQLQHINRWPEPDDLSGVTLVISAAADAELDARISEICRRTNTLLNVVDVIPRCDFYMPGVVARGPVTVAIGTAGTSPALVGAIRERIEALLPQQLGDLAARLGGIRPMLKSRFPDFAGRARRMRHVARILLTEMATGADLVRVEGLLQRMLSCEEACEDQGSCCLNGK